ncbi:hypothetical protein [Pseudomonas sp. DSP3-2-2]|uniref:hypothetical protein n=1 Tax=unclassified Pseudomonas TaxID=196821 RepID=UPI003CF4434E
MSTEIARAHMVSELSRLAEDLEFSAAGLGKLRKAEGLMDAETSDLIKQIRYTSAQLKLLAGQADKGVNGDGTAK